MFYETAMRTIPPKQKSDFGELHTVNALCKETKMNTKKTPIRIKKQV